LNSDRTESVEFRRISAKCAEFVNPGPGQGVGTLQICFTRQEANMAWESSDEEKKLTDEETDLDTWIACMVKKLIEGFLVGLLYIDKEDL
jgi:hypothetical protein